MVPCETSEGVKLVLPSPSCSLAALLHRYIASSTVHCDAKRRLGIQNLKTPEPATHQSQRVLTRMSRAAKDGGVHSGRNVPNAV